MKEETRRPDHRKDGRYEALVARMNADVAALPPPSGAPRRPVVFVVGVPRSGTTLTYQVLAATGAFAYPSNVVARFWRRPGHGVRVQRLLDHGREHRRKRRLRALRLLDHVHGGVVPRCNNCCTELVDSQACLNIRVPRNKEL